MSDRFTLPRHRRALATATAAALALALAACGSSTNSPKDTSMPGMDHSTPPSASASPSAMPSMNGMDAGSGLTAARAGYTLTSGTATLPTGTAADYRFTITGPDGKPVTDFAVDQTKRLHFYAIRSDLTGFQHIHPTMAKNGTWSAPLAALRPGTWRLFASFTPTTGPGMGTDFVLSRTVKVPGMPMTSALPKASTTAKADGYTVTVKGDLTAGMAHQITATITKDGQPVTDLQPYLDTYAHLTAFHQGDLAFAHSTPKPTPPPTTAARP